MIYGTVSTLVDHRAPRKCSDIMVTVTDINKSFNATPPPSTSSEACLQLSPEVCLSPALTGDRSTAAKPACEKVTVQVY